MKRPRRERRSGANVVGNIAVVAAAAGIFTTQRGWPDIAVALIMGVLSLSGACQILRHAQRDLTKDRTGAHAAHEAHA